MFDSIRSRHRFFTILIMMVFVIPTFIATGVYSYNQFRGTDTSVAVIGSEKISQQDFDVAFRMRLEQMAQTLGANFDARAFDTPQARAATLDSLLSERTLDYAARKEHVTVSVAKLQEVIASVPAFQQAGRFDYNTYKMLLTARGQSEGEFEGELRGSLAQQTLAQAVTTSAFIPNSVAARLWQLQHEKRQIREAAFRPEAFYDKVQIGEDAIRAEYEKDKARYMSPETVKVEYLVLRAQDLIGQVSVSPEQIQAYYDGNMKRWGEAERRRASHILVTAGPGGSALDKVQARKLAESVLAKVRAHPGDFTALAKQYSKDPGSAEKGGDLGWFGRGMMVKPFEYAAFSLKSGETSGLVESDFGFHIIRLTGIEASHTKSLGEVKAQIEGELAEQAAQKRFSEIAEQFSNVVYEQSDGLKAAADKFKLTLHEADGVTRRGAPQGEAGATFTPPLLAAIFAPDSLEKRRNTKAIDVGVNTLASARVLDYHAAAPIPLEVVKEGIKSALQRAAAQDMASKAGESRLAELRKSPDERGFDAPRWIGRDDPQQLPAAALNTIMGLPSSSLPAFVGVVGGDGAYRVVQVMASRAADPLPAGGGDAPLQQWARQVSSADEFGYVHALRERYGARVSRTDLASPAPEDKSE